MSSLESKLKSSPQSWDDCDDELLIRLKEVEHLGWKQIANYFNNRTSNACQFRWRRLKSGQLKKAGRAKRFGLEKTLSNPTDDLNYIPESESITSQRILNPSHSQHQHQQQHHFSPWTPQEDTLVLSRNVKGLTIMELSILLSNRTGKEIEERIKFLDQKKVSVASLITDTNTSSDVEQDLLNSRNSSSSSIATVSSFNNNLPMSTLVPNIGLSPLPFTSPIPSSIPSKYPQQSSYKHQYMTPNQPIRLPPLQNITSGLHNSFNYNNYNNNNNNNNSRSLGTSIPMFKYGDNSQRDQRLPSLSQVYSFISQ